MTNQANLSKENNNQRLYLLEPFASYLTYEPEDLNRICQKVIEFDPSADGKHFFAYMRSGLLNKKILPFISYDDKGEVAGCAVVSISQTPMSSKDVLYVQWVWMNPHYQKLIFKGIDLLMELCKKYGIKRIVGNTKRLPEAFQRKYGFKQTDAIIEKEVI